MKNLSEKFTDMSRNVRLTEAEKQAMREYLVRYQAMHPLRAVPSPFSFFSFKPVPALAVITLFFVGSIGVSAAAQSALPGDALYPVKVSVNEKVRGLFAFSDEAKAAHEITLADTRLSEAEALAEEGRLSTSTEESLAADFSTDAHNAKEHIRALKADNFDAAVVSQTKLDAVFAAHEGILAGISAKVSDRNTLISTVRSERSDEHGSIHAAAAFAADASVPVTVSDTAASSSVASNADLAAALAMKQAALDSYAKAQAALERYSGKLSAETKTAAEASLSAAQALIAEGDTHVSLGTDDSVSVGFSDYRQALAAAEELRLRIKSNASIHLPSTVTPQALSNFSESENSDDGSVSGNVHVGL